LTVDSSDGGVVQTVSLKGLLTKLENTARARGAFDPPPLPESPNVKFLKFIRHCNWMSSWLRSVRKCPQYFPAWERWITRLAALGNLPRRTPEEAFSAIEALAEAEIAENIDEGDDSRSWSAAEAQESDAAFDAFLPAYRAANAEHNQWFRNRTWTCNAMAAMDAESRGIKPPALPLCPQCNLYHGAKPESGASGLDGELEIAIPAQPAPHARTRGQEDSSARFMTYPANGPIAR
jgi:hypothetical protein